MTLNIDCDRLLGDLRALREFGRLTAGVGRVSYSDADTAARAWLRERMLEAGLETAVDDVGNVFGRTPGNGPAVVIGSHTDSVPVGGWLDGSFGVICGLEIARSAAEAGLAVEVVSFMDEEGTYLACLGSRAFCGDLGAGELEAARGPAGESARAAIERCGYAGNAAVRCDPDRHLAYLEAHIEQGPRLEAAGKAIGVVTGIVGMRRYRIAIAGEADHAGTVPMSMRKDAGRAAILCAAGILEDLPRAGGPDSVWNIGAIDFRPGADNVVPASASVSVEIRDLSAEVVAAMERAVTERVAAVERETGLPCSVATTLEVEPAAMDEGLMGKLRDAASACGAGCMDMPSGAGHDAMVTARCLPSAMLFVPSIRGKSHSEAEDTHPDDLALGCRVLAAAVERIAG